jgi:hypothetical protein
MVQLDFVDYPSFKSAVNTLVGRLKGNEPMVMTYAVLLTAFQAAAVFSEFQMVCTLTVFTMSPTFLTDYPTAIQGVGLGIF